jgi:hypothetical protein
VYSLLAAKESAPTVMVFTARTGSSTAGGLEQPSKKTDPMAATLMIFFMTMGFLRSASLACPALHHLIND